jgi:hypothetical protein
VAKGLTEYCHFVTEALPVRPLAVKLEELVPEQTDELGPTEPLRGIPKVRELSLHLEDVGDPPLTEESLAIFITPGLFGLQILIPIAPNGI